jgi:four helix bundle protein
MKEYKTFKDLNVWVSARKLCVEIYSLTQAFPMVEQFGLTNQLRRASVSIASNIAEGYGRQYKKETIQFLHTSKGSINEVEAQLMIACDLKFVKEEDLKNVFESIEATRKQLIGYIKYLSNTSELK